MLFKSAIYQLLKTNEIKSDITYGDLLFDLSILFFSDKQLVMLLIDKNQEDYFYSNEKEILNWIQDKNFRIIFLFERDWFENPTILENRILSLWKIRNRIHGRACTIERINKVQSDEFLITNHSLGKSGAFYHFGLFYKNELKAVASFSKARIMTYEVIPYYSYVWERYASASDCTIIGGMSKLLKAFLDETSAKHIMTYADKNWGNGDAFLKLGFKVISESETLNSKIRNNNLSRGISSIGSLKFILDLR
jgi:hypothetical protein